MTKLRFEDLDIDIVSPSGKAQHSAEEWKGYIEANEEIEARNDIRKVRGKLGKFTIRYLTEAFLGEEEALRLYGETGGQILLEDIQLNEKFLKQLVANVGGEKARKVAAKIKFEAPREVLLEEEVVLEEVVETKPEATVESKQIELLQALFRTLDPAVLKKALTGS